MKYNAVLFFLSYVKNNIAKRTCRLDCLCYAVSSDCVLYGLILMGLKSHGWTSVLSRGSRNTPGHFMLLKPG